MYKTTFFSVGLGTRQVHTKSLVDLIFHQIFLAIQELIEWSIRICVWGEETGTRRLAITLCKEQKNLVDLILCQIFPAKWYLKEWEERMIEDSRKEGKRRKQRKGQEKGGFRVDKADEEDRQREENHLLMLS